MKKPWCGIIVIAFVAALAVPAGAQDTGTGGGIRVLEVDEQPVRARPGVRSVNRILAVVENQAITMGDYVNEFGDTELTRPKLNRLINKALIRQAGRQAGIVLDRNRVLNFVDTRLKRVKQRGTRAFRRFLRRRGMTERAYRQRLTERIRDQRLKSRVLIRYFPQLARPDTRAAQQLIKGRLMILPDSSTAYTVYRALKKQPRMSTWNEMFEKHSRKLSFTGPHGELDWFSWGTYQREIEYRFFKNDLFRLSRPFEFRGSYGLVIPTGFRLDTLRQSVPQKRYRLYQSFRRRYYTERLSKRLRDRFSVNIPESVQREFDFNV